MMTAKTLFYFSGIVEAVVAISLIWILLKICKTIYLRSRFKCLKDKVVVITGASSGIGEALAHEFYKRGSLVVLCARRKEELERIKTDLLHRKYYKNKNAPIVMPLDLTDVDSIHQIVKKIISLTDQIDILINNAGILHNGTILSTNLDVHMKVMKTNYFGTIAITKSVLHEMIQRKVGHIVFVSSVLGLIAIPKKSAYSASKHAMQAFADSLRAEVRKFNVSVTTACPGYTKTDISIKGLNGSGEAYGAMEEEIKNGYTTQFVAEQMVQAIVCKSKEIVISQFFPKMAVIVRKQFSSLYFLIMAYRYEHGYD